MENKKKSNGIVETGHFENDNSVEAIKASIIYHLQHTMARSRNTASKHDWWVSVSLAVRDRILENMIRTQAVYAEKGVRRVYYFSLEYLMGRLLTNNMLNAGIYEQTCQALQELGQDCELVREEESDMGLGNGGLGRLAACFLDSLATMDLPALGYGIYYEFGLFRQEIACGYQLEHPDNWAWRGNPWVIERSDYTQEVRLYGRVEDRRDDEGKKYSAWVDTRSLLGVPYDVPVCGYGTKTVNFLRLWSSNASEDFDLHVFNEGGYVEAVREKAIGETVSKVLYPNDQTESGKELRLVQQYFFVSCSLHDIIRRFRRESGDWSVFPEKATIQLNDTHPAVAVPELMRILVDEEGIAWEEAWGIVTRTFAYTNHTLLPEALEKWSVSLFERVLPRHLQIIYEINARHLKEVEARWPGDKAKKQELSLVEEGDPKMIRMAYLAVAGSYAVNGVAGLHTELLKKYLFSGLSELYPGRIQNKTNGITPRRWLPVGNPRLSELLTKHIGDKWIRDLGELRKLEPYADDPGFKEAFMAVKRANKERLASLIRDQCGVEVDPDAMFDVQIKRIHEYKRQHLNLLHIMAHYRRLLRDPSLDVPPRVFIFGGKAAPGYDLAKRIIRAITAVGERINGDERIAGKVKVVFLPNYSVSLASRIIPAADLSEQISTAGKEASGTGNMKLALNGAVTVGTLDGANVEIREEVGDDNIFIFGLTAEEVEAVRSKGYDPYAYYRKNEELRKVLDWLASGELTPEDSKALDPLVHSLLDGGDPFLVLADFEAYCRAQKEADRAYRDKDRWARMAILNTARSGKFSSDRTIAEYARDIWKLEPVEVE